MGVKISELPYLYSADNYDELILNYSASGSWATGRITREALLSGYLSIYQDGGSIHASSDLDDYLSQQGFLSLGYDQSGAVTDSTGMLSQYLSEAGVLFIISDNGSLSEVTGLLSSYLGQENYLSLSLSGNSYNNNQQLEDYLSQYGYVRITMSGSDYIPDNYLYGYVQQEGFITASNFADAMYSYLSSYAQSVYDAISPYLSSQ